MRPEVRVPLQRAKENLLRVAECEDPLAACCALIDSFRELISVIEDQEKRREQLEATIGLLRVEYMGTESRVAGLRTCLQAHGVDVRQVEEKRVPA
jgi:hypothetical protein